MTQRSNPSFVFHNLVSPRYIEPLLIQIQYGQWYGTAQFTSLLRSNGLDVKGHSIAVYNMSTWSIAGLGQLEKSGASHLKKNIFRLTDLGKQLVDTYSTNSELFYDLMHFIFYSAYHRSYDVRKGRFWLYASICDNLWQEAPAPIDASALTNWLQIESRVAFPDYDPSFSEQSVRGVFSWLQILTPPFLSKSGTGNQLISAKRSHCTPQLFHLATDMIYSTVEGLQYGASLAINERHIIDICKTCLLDIERFWDLADLTEMTINGFEIRRGQWGTSIALEGPPTWITLPDFSYEKAQPDMNEFEDGVEE